MTLETESQTTKEEDSCWGGGGGGGGSQPSGVVALVAAVSADIVAFPKSGSFSVVLSPYIRERASEVPMTAL